MKSPETMTEPKELIMTKLEMAKDIAIALYPETYPTCCSAIVGQTEVLMKKTKAELEALHTSAFLILIKRN